MRTTVSLSDELAAYVDENFAQDDASDAQAIREAVAHAKAQDERVGELLDEIEALETDLEAARTRAERLENEKRMILEEREEHDELVEYVEEEQTYRKAGLATRAKWWLFGMGDE